MKDSLRKDLRIKRVVFIGGHHTSAMAVMRNLVKERKDIEIHFIGHKFSAYKDKNTSSEYREIAQENIPFYNLRAGKIYRIFNLKRLLLLPFGFFQALYFLIKIKPSLVISFGGYLAVPVVFWAWVLRIPVITHEQTLQSGWANIFVSKLSRSILLTWESSLDFFPKEKSKVIGLPIVKDFEKKDITYGIFKNKLPLVFITGGKQGAHVINEVIGKIFKDLTEFCNVVIQCGDNSYFKDFDKLKDLIASLPVKSREQIIVKRFLSRSEQLTMIQKADLLVGRAGAHFMYEVCFYKKPVLFIPLPNTSHNEQYKNALFVERLGLAKILNQDLLTKGKILEDIQFMLKNLEEYGLRKYVSLPENASQKFVQEINKFI